MFESIHALVVLRSPIFKADEAELVSAVASHMVASLIFLNKYFAFRAPFPLFELELKILIAWSLM